MCIRDRANDERGPAGGAGTLSEPDHRNQCRKQWRREIDGDGAGERHQREGQNTEGLGDRLRQSARDMVAWTPGGENPKPGEWQHRGRGDGECGQRAEAHHLADGVDRDLPFRSGTREREQQGRAGHEQDPARNVVLRLHGCCAALLCAVGRHGLLKRMPGPLQLKWVKGLLVACWPCRRSGRRFTSRIARYILQLRASTTPLMRLQSNSMGATSIMSRSRGTIRSRMPSISAASFRCSACAVSTVTGSNAIFAPIGRRPSAGMSAEITVAILG